MATSSGQFHEAADDLRPETQDRHRAAVSQSEELEAVDWYDQSIDAAGSSRSCPGARPRPPGCGPAP